MKDMTVEELIDIVAHTETSVSRLHKARAELLRRFEALRCCGNCKSYHTRSDCMMKHEYRPNQYCDMWQSDGLSWEEREGK
jgi:hypothetical protein